MEIEPRNRRAYRQTLHVCATTVLNLLFIVFIYIFLYSGSRFGSGGVPLRAARSSVEGLNQEIERIVLCPASGTQTPYIDRIRDKVCYLICYVYFSDFYILVNRNAENVQLINQFNVSIIELIIIFLKLLKQNKRKYFF